MGVKTGGVLPRADPHDVQQSAAAAMATIRDA
jgi:hypothetical protein